MYSNWYADYAAIWKHCLYITTSWDWSWWSSTNIWQCHLNLKNDTKILPNPAAMGGETFGGQTKLLTLKLGKNIGIYTLQNNWQKDVQQAWIWNWFLIYDRPGLARWSLEQRMALSIGGKIKMNVKELMCGFIWGQKRVLHLRRVGQIIFFVCSLAVKLYKILCIDMTDRAGSAFLNILT